MGFKFELIEKSIKEQDGVVSVSLESPRYCLSGACLIGVFAHTWRGV